MSCIWSKANNATCDPINKLLKYVARIFLGKVRRTESVTSDLLKKLNWLFVHEIQQKAALLTMYKIIKLSGMPVSLTNLLTVKQCNISYRLRSDVTATVVYSEPCTKTKKCESSFSYSAPRLWNELVTPELSKLRLAEFSANVSNLLLIKACERLNVA